MVKLKSRIEILIKCDSLKFLFQDYNSHFDDLM